MQHVENRFQDSRIGYSSHDSNKSHCLDEDVHAISGEIKDKLSTLDDKRIILNLEKVELMASLMVGELVLLLKLFEQKSAVLRLCSLNPVVIESLRITGICDLLPIDENEESGLTSITA